MTSEAISELRGFLAFVGEQVHEGHANLTPEECLNRWRTQHPSADDLEESVAAVKEALADMDAGDPATPFDDFVDDLRSRNNIPRDK